MAASGKEESRKASIVSSWGRQGNKMHQIAHLLPGLRAQEAEGGCTAVAALFAAAPPRAPHCSRATPRRTSHAATSRQPGWAQQQGHWGRELHVAKGPWHRLRCRPAGRLEGCWIVATVLGELLCQRPSAAGLLGQSGHCQVELVCMPFPRSHQQARKRPVSVIGKKLWDCVLRNVNVKVDSLCLNHMA